MTGSSNRLSSVTVSNQGRLPGEGRSSEKTMVEESSGTFFSLFLAVVVRGGVEAYECVPWFGHGALLSASLFA